MVGEKDKSQAHGGSQPMGAEELMIIIAESRQCLTAAEKKAQRFKTLYEKDKWNTALVPSLQELMYSSRGEVELLTNQIKAMEHLQQLDAKRRTGMSVVGES